MAVCSGCRLRAVLGGHAGGGACQHVKDQGYLPQMLRREELNGSGGEEEEKLRVSIDTLHSLVLARLFKHLQDILLVGRNCKNKRHLYMDTGYHDLAE